MLSDTVQFILLHYVDLTEVFVLGLPSIECHLHNFVKIVNIEDVVVLELFRSIS